MPKLDIVLGQVEVTGMTDQPNMWRKDRESVSQAQTSSFNEKKSGRIGKAEDKKSRVV